MKGYVLIYIHALPARMESRSREAGPRPLLIILFKRAWAVKDCDGRIRVVRGWMPMLLCHRVAGGLDGDEQSHVADG